MAMEMIQSSNIVREINLPTFIVSLFGALGGIGFGVDYGFWSGVLGMEQFKVTFGVYEAATDSYSIPSTWQSVGSGPPTAGLAIGALLSGAVGGRLGRLNTFRLASVISLVGILIQATVRTSYWQIVVGRVVNSLALGVLANVTPAYLAEVSPLSIRGSVINSYQFAVGVGAVLVNTANWGTHAWDDSWSYRLPIVLQIVIPVVFLPGSFFVPESPRWLVGQGRDNEALAALRYLRGAGKMDSGEDQDRRIENERDLISAQEEENKLKFSAAWVDCFRGSNLRRTLIATGVQCLQQAQGSSFMSSYAVVFFQTLGIKDEYRIMILLLMVQTIASAFAFCIPDRVGRRIMLISMALVMAVCMIVVSVVMGFQDFAARDSSLKAATACVFIWQFATSVGWSSCVWIITAETPSLQLREKSITIATFSGFTISILITFLSPFIQDQGYGGLGARIGFLWGGFSIAAAAWTFFCVPETGFRSLEELDELFQQGVSVRKFSKKQTRGSGARLAKAEEHMGPDDEVIDGKEVAIATNKPLGTDKSAATKG